VLLDISPTLAHGSTVLGYLPSACCGRSRAEIQVRPGLRGGSCAAGIDRDRPLCKSSCRGKLSAYVIGPEGLRMYSRFVRHQP
jgi:hypothetical protein